MDNSLVYSKCGGLFRVAHVWGEWCQVAPAGDEYGQPLAACGGQSNASSTHKM